MTTATVPIAELTDTTIVATLVSSHGSIALAAERLNTSKEALIERLPYLPYDELQASIKTARLLQIFDAFIVMKDVMVNTLPDLSPEARAKFMIQFIDRFELMLSPPPVQGESSPTHAFQFNFGSPEAEVDARANLAERLVQIKSNQQESPHSLQESDSGRPNHLVTLPTDGSGDDAPVRLGVDGKARATGTDSPVDDMATVDRTRVG